MGAGLKKCETPRDVFECLSKAKRMGVPVVPLIGAGLSLESGVPTTGLMIDYMAKFKLLIDLKVKKDEDLVYAEHLKTEHWLDLFELNAILQKKLSDRIESGRKPGATPPKWLKEFIDPRESLKRSAGSLLGAVRLFTIHQYLELAQPSLLGFVSGTGACPVTGALTSALFDVLDQAAAAAGPLNNERKDAIKRRLKELLIETGLRDRILTNMALDWRAMLRLLTSGIPALVDSFFDRMVRGHSPGIGHQFLALMTESLNCRLWLTTNFDDLIERALREQRIDPTVFELPDSGPVPDHILFSDVPSVVKLHGSGYALRVGESLDTPLDKPNLDVFKYYFPEDAIVLVIGYGGGDRRVMSLIERLVIDHEYKKLPKIIWVYRDRLPSSVLRAARGDGKQASRPPDNASVAVLQYRSGGLFLREMYEELTGSHAASRVTYNALPMLPPRPADRSESSRNVAPPTPDALESSVTIISGYPTESETSTRLVDRVDSLAGSHQVIWCDATEVPTLDVLISVVLDEFYHLDPGLIPGSSDFEAGPIVAEQIPVERLANRLFEALLRGKYVLAIDAVGGFGRHDLAHHLCGPSGLGRSRPATDAPDPFGCRALLRDFKKLRLPKSVRLTVNRLTLVFSDLAEINDSAVKEVHRLCRFLQAICRETERMGESKLCVAFTRPRLPAPVEATFETAITRLDQLKTDLASRPKTVALLDDFRRRTSQALDQLKTSLASGPAGLDPLTKDEGCRFHFDRPRNSSAKCPSGAAKNHDALDSIAEQKAFRHDLDRLQKKDQGRFELLRVASVFRRPRHILALKFVVAQIRRDNPGKNQDWEIDKVVRSLTRVPDGPSETSPYFLYQEGGFYQMQSWVRDEIYHQFAQASDTLDRAHGFSAAYYEILFHRSNSLTAFFESIYHSAAYYRARPSPRRWEGLIRRIGARLGRARRILRYGPPVRVFEWLTTLQDAVERSKPPVGADRRPADRLIDTLGNLRAQVLDSLGDDRLGLRIRLDQVFAMIEKRVGGSLTLPAIRAIRKSYDPLNPADGQALVRLAVRLREAGRHLAAIERSKNNAGLDDRLNVGSARVLLESHLLCGRILRDTRAKVAPGVVRRALEVDFGCRLALIDWLLDSADIEGKVGRPLEGLQRKRIERRCEQAEDILRRCTRSYAKNYSREWAALKLRQARAGYLAGWHGFEDDLTRAYEFLEDARAAAYVGQGDEDIEIMVEIRLRTVEALLIHADWMLTKVKQAVDEQEMSEAAAITPEMVAAQFRHAVVALDQSRSTLTSGPSNLRDWGRWKNLRKTCQSRQQDWDGLALSFKALRESSDSV